jgi:hypothetical protein
VKFAVMLSRYERGAKPKEKGRLNLNLQVQVVK